MTPVSAIIAYPPEPAAIGTASDGRPVTLAPMTAEAAAALGTATASFGPWHHYGISAAAMTRSFTSAPGNGAYYQAQIDGALVGGMVIRDPWLVGPYLQTIAVLPLAQGSGAGGLMLDWFEARARLAGQRNVWLCVSAFNSDAQRFYRAHGWQHAADFRGLIRDGIGEVLMRKVLG